MRLGLLVLVGCGGGSRALVLVEPPPPLVPFDDPTPVDEPAPGDCPQMGDGSLAFAEGRLLTVDLCERSWDEDSATQVAALEAQLGPATCGVGQAFALGCFFQGGGIEVQVAGLDDAGRPASDAYLGYRVTLAVHDPSLVSGTGLGLGVEAACFGQALGDPGEERTVDRWTYRQWSWWGGNEERTLVVSPVDGAVDTLWMGCNSDE